MRKKTFIAVWHKIQRDGCKENANLCSYLKFVKKLHFSKNLATVAVPTLAKPISKLLISCYSPKFASLRQNSSREMEKMRFHPIDNNSRIEISSWRQGTYHQSNSGCTSEFFLKGSIIFHNWGNRETWYIRFFLISES